MSKAIYERCHDSHQATGTIGWPAPYPKGYTGAHASMRTCERSECQASANRWVRKHTEHDGIYRSFEQSRRERAELEAVSA
jgi:hypothetical protein